MSPVIPCNLPGFDGVEGFLEISPEKKRVGRTFSDPRASRRLGAAALQGTASPARHPELRQNNGLVRLTGQGFTGNGSFR